jgi:hypothetical protein
MSDCRGAAALRRENPANLAVHQEGQQLMKILHGEDLKVPTWSSQRPQQGADLSDLIAALAPRAVTLLGRVMWLRTPSSSLVTKRNKRAGEVGR